MRRKRRSIRVDCSRLCKRDVAVFHIVSPFVNITHRESRRLFAAWNMFLSDESFRIQANIIRKRRRRPGSRPRKVLHKRRDPRENVFPWRRLTLRRPDYATTKSLVCALHIALGQRFAWRRVDSTM